jgi:delta 1-pyrroline-5-carboxylate dehydrogenase
MSLGYFHYPAPINEPVLNYGPGSKEKEGLKKALKELKSKEHDIPMYIGDKEVRTGRKITLHPPHEIAHTLGYFHEGDENHVQQAIDAALQAKEGLGRTQLGEQGCYLSESCRSAGNEIPSIYQRHYHAGAKQECLPG